MFIGAFRGEGIDRDVRGKYVSEEQIVQGIYDIGMHVSRRISRHKTWSFLLEPTDLTKYDFVKKVQADRDAKLQASFVDAFGLSGIAAK